MKFDPFRSPVRITDGDGDDVANANTATSTSMTMVELDQKTRMMKELMAMGPSYNKHWMEAWMDAMIHGGGGGGVGAATQRMIKGGYGAGATTQPTPNPKIPTSQDLLKMIAMRLRYPEGNKLPFDHIYALENKDRVFVFVVNDDQQPIILEDTKALFPSDALITQVRLLEKK